MNDERTLPDCWRDFARQGDYQVERRGERGWDLVRIALIVAVLTSAGWAYLLAEERALHSQLLAEVTARHARVERLTIQYSNGAKASVEIKERTQ